MPSRRTLTRLLRAVGARVGIVVAIWVLLAGVLRGGKSYFFCPMMDAAFDAPCCGGEHGEQRESAQLRAPDCCKARRLGTLPASAVSSVPEVAASPCVAVMPAIDAVASRYRTTEQIRFAQPARAGPPTAKERRAELRVWLS